MGRKLDLTGKRFGRLVVIKRHHIGCYHRNYWLLKCDCGGEKISAAGDLSQMNILSCGCIRKEMLIKRNTKHSMCGTRIYGIYRGMITRCENKKRKEYINYGGRGIKICKAWRNSFKVFLKWSQDNGYKKNLTIERFNNDGDYKPSNCTWITQKEQAKNKRKRDGFPERDNLGRFKPRTTKN